VVEEPDHPTDAELLCGYDGTPAQGGEFRQHDPIQRFITIEHLEQELHVGLAAAGRQGMRQTDEQARLELSQLRVQGGVS